MGAGALHGGQYRYRRRRGGGRAAPLWGALLLLACGPEGAPPPAPPGAAASRPNVVLITLDTTRADRLGLYGYSRNTSPNLDFLAKQSVVYTRAVATSSWTLPSHASLFTGRIPTAHGARFHPDGEFVLSLAIAGPEGYDLHRASSISPQERTLAERLGDAGYATAGVAGGPWLECVFGLCRGFDHYRDEGIDGIGGAPAGRVTDAALELLAGMEPPFFLFVNYFDPHGPRADLPQQRRALGLARDDGSPQAWVDLYDAEIRYMDEQIQRLLAALRERGVWDDTLVIAVGDHGELLGEQGQEGHGLTLSEAELHVPLIVKHARGGPAPGRDTTRVSIASVFATILERAGLEPPPGTEPPLERAAGAVVVAETFPTPTQSSAGQWRALYQGNLKLHWNSLGEHRLHDLSTDPGEDHNLYGSQPAAARALEELLEERLAATPRTPRPPSGAPKQVDPELSEALRKLGYLD